MMYLWEHRIGGLTYRKRVTDEWPVEEFKAHEVSLPEGASTRMRLAMRQTRLRAGKAAHDRAISLLLKDLTDEEFTHPDTGAKVVYCLK